MAEELGVRPETVQKWLTRAREGRPLDGRVNNGSEPTIVDSNIEFLQEIVESEPEVGLYDLVERLKAHNGKSVWPETLSRHLAARGIRKVRPTLVDAEDSPADNETRYKDEHRREASHGGKYPSSLTDHEWDVSSLCSKSWHLVVRALPTTTAVSFLTRSST